MNGHDGHSIFGGLGGGDNSRRPAFVDPSRVDSVSNQSTTIGQLEWSSFGLNRSMDFWCTNGD